MEHDGKYIHSRPHPWHGLDVGPSPPEVVHAYVEITPYDLVKYEVDKRSGYLRVDRPNRSSSQSPSLYGFIPRTYSGTAVATLSPNAGGGDGDPLDICVLSERPNTRAEVVIDAKVVGVIRAIDAGLADDKIIAVLANDDVWRDVSDVADLPPVLVERLRHYFTSYKQIPGEPPTLLVEAVEGRESAFALIRAAMADYEVLRAEDDDRGPAPGLS